MFKESERERGREREREKEREKERKKRSKKRACVHAQILEYPVSQSVGVSSKKKFFNQICLSALVYIYILTFLITLLK